MNRREFKTWYDEYVACFPDTGSWLAGQPDGSRRILLEGWYQALARCDLVDARAVTMRMLAGDDPPIKAYERDQTSSTVCTLAMQAKARRVVQTSEPPVQGDLAEPTWSAADAFKRLTDAMHVEHVPGEPRRLFAPIPRKLVDEILADCPTTPDDQQPRYSCPHCRDVGMRFVWSLEAMKAALAGEFDARHRRSASVACLCKTGQRFLADRIIHGKNRGPFAIPFDEARMIPCDATPTVDDVANLLERIKNFRYAGRQQPTQQEVPF